MRGSGTGRRSWLGCVGLVLLLAAGPAAAGRPCEEHSLDPRTAERAVNLALDTRARLDASGAEVALIGRAGQNLSQYGLRYSHLGFAWRDHPKGVWRVVHQLNECGTDRSEIYDEGLANFFLDDLWKMEAVILLPPQPLQQQLAALLSSRRHLGFHQPRYNMVAYPFSTRYQNSNQWALEVIAAAEARDAKVTTRTQAQQWLRLAGYQPTELRLDALARLGARLTRVNIAFDDHPGELRWADRIRTVTVDSVFAFLAARGPGAVQIEVVPR